MEFWHRLYFFVLINISPITRVEGESKETMLNPEKCGLSNKSTFRIIGGVSAKLYEFPSLAGLGFINPHYENVLWLCGGTLITYRHVLTAAHCLKDKNLKLHVVRVGDWDLDSDTPGDDSEDIKVIKVAVHEKHDDRSQVNDIAIITLERTPSLPWVLPACLPINEPLKNDSFEKKQGIIIGRGSPDFDGESFSNIQASRVPIRNTSECLEPYKIVSAVIDDNVICAGRGDGFRDACQGDSGGPLLLGKKIADNFVKYYVIGIVSYGIGCAEVGIPGVYTRVTSFVDWIQKNVKEI